MRSVVLFFFLAVVSLFAQGKDSFIFQATDGSGNPIGTFPAFLKFQPGPNCSASVSGVTVVFNCGGGAAAAYHDVTYSATPAFTATSNTLDIFHVALTGNVTSSTISGMSSGEFITISWCQPVGGGASVVWPVLFQNAGTVNTTANSCSTQTFYYNGTNFIAQSALLVTNAAGDGITLAASTSGMALIQPASTVAAGTTFTIPSGNTNGVAGIANPSDSNCVTWIGTDGSQNRGSCGGGGSGIGTIFGQNINAADTSLSGAETYSGPGVSTFSTAIAARAYTIPTACTMKNLYVITTTAQSSNNNLVVSVNKNGTDGAVTINIPASGAAGTYSDTTHTVAFAAGDQFAIGFLNNANASTGTIKNWAVQCQ